MENSVWIICNPLIILFNVRCSTIAMTSIESQLNCIFIYDTQSAYLEQVLSQNASPERKNASRALSRIEDRIRSYTSECLLRKTLGDIGISKSRLTIITNAFGKPELANFPDVHFNISHSENCVVCAVSSQPIGVDVEKIKPIDYSMTKICFSENERLQLIQRLDNDRLDYFFRLWTMKESYIKALGTGLSKELTSFSVNLHRNIGSVFDPMQPDTYHLFEYDIHPAYKLSLCSMLPIKPSPAIYSITDVI